MRIQHRLQFSFLSLLLIGCLILFLGCGQGGTTSKKFNNGGNDDVSFAGTWLLDEELENSDCGWENNVNHIRVVISQNGSSATLSDGTNSFACQVEGEELQCSGEILHDDDSRFRYDQITLWHDGNGNLTGNAKWTFIAANSATCSGTATYSPYTPEPEDASAFVGNWQVRETLSNCSNAADFRENFYRVNIVENNGKIQLFYSNQFPFECTFSNERLYCSGDVELEGGGIRDYPEYNIWLTSNGYLLGEATWGFTSPENEQCDSSSLIRGGRDEDPSDDGPIPNSAIKIINNTEITYEQINIMPCGGDRASDEDWGPERMHPTVSLVPSGSYHIANIPEGCYDVRICPVDENAMEAGCIHYIGTTVTEGEVRELELN